MAFIEPLPQLEKADFQPSRRISSKLVLEDPVTYHSTHSCKNCLTTKSFSWSAFCPPTKEGLTPFPSFLHLLHVPKNFLKIKILVLIQLLSPYKRSALWCLGRNWGELILDFALGLIFTFHDTGCTGISIIRTCYFSNRTKYQPVIFHRHL